jgi:mannose-6-phosphate isomerase-like protein (cupin superfamily)
MPEPLVTDLSSLLAAQGGRSYHEFLRVPALSLGLFAVGAGHADTQQPHAVDEVYVVVAGAGTLLVDGVSSTVNTGSIAYVPAGVTHRFVDVTADLQVYVVFAPPEP